MRRLKCFSFGFILLGAFVLSHLAIGLNQARAVDITQLVQYITTWDITHSPVGNGTCVPNYQAGTSTISAFWYVSNTSSSSPCSWNDSVLSLGGLGFNDKYIFQVDYYLYDIRDKEEINSYANQPPTLRMDNGRFPLNYIGADYKLMDSDSGIISYYFNIPYTNTLTINDNFRIITNIGLQVNETIAMSSKMTIWSYYQAVGGSGGGGNYTQIINAINTVNNTIDSWSNTQTQRLDSILQIIRDNQQNMESISESLQEQADKDQEDRDNIEQQKQENQTSADDAGSDASSIGTSLFSAFTQLLGALTNINGSSCRLPNIQVYSLNLGSMDLCTYTIPPQIMALVSIGMVFIIIPLGIHLVKKMIGLYKEITG